MEKVITGFRYVEIMWPFNDMFRSRLHDIRTVPYSAQYESEADAAITRLAESPDTAWVGVSDGAWRVLLERHIQMNIVALANEAAGNPLMTLPPGPDLSEDDLRVGLALLWLLKMKLPFPVEERSSFVLPTERSVKAH